MSCGVFQYKPGRCIEKFMVNMLPRSEKKFGDFLGSEPATLW